MQGKMKVTIISFSFKRGLPEDASGNGGGFVFDCRAMPNPFWDETLRGYTGRDRPVADFFARFPETVEPFLEATETLVRQSIREYRRDGKDHLQVAFEQEKISILGDDRQIDELGYYEADYNPKTRVVTYNAPRGLNDDTVVALMISWEAYLSGNRVGRYCVGSAGA